MNAINTSLTALEFTRIQRVVVNSENQGLRLVPMEGQTGRSKLDGLRMTLNETKCQILAAKFWQLEFIR